MTMATLALAVVLAVGVAIGLWLLDQRAERRLAAIEKVLVPAVKEASRSAAISIATEFDQRLGAIVRSELESRQLLASAASRLAGCETALSLMPAAISSLRELLDHKFQEWEEKQVPPEGQEIAATAMSRIRSHREALVKLEQESLDKFIAATKEPNYREPIIRVRVGA